MISISNKNEYKTVKGAGESLFVDRKSRFISHTIPVSSEEEALEFLQSMRSEYSDANHNVYAYIIDENNIFRYSDDGEPSGTSGMPVLDTMRKEGLVDIITVVTRYFGGTLLGTGGLVHAYTTAASESVKNAGIIKRVLCDCYDIKVEYTLAGKVQYLISSEGCFLDESIYEESVTFKISLFKEQVKGFLNKLAEATAGRAVAEKTSEKYKDITN